ncbi:glycosyltransferase, partial [Chloroflexota bacterium]
MNFNGLQRYETLGGVEISRIPCLRLQESVCRPFEMATYILRAIPVMNKIAQHSNYEINHTHFIFPDGILAFWLKRRSGLPYIITAHGSDVPGYNPNRFKYLHQILKPLWIRVVNEAEEIVTPSYSLGDLIAKQKTITKVSRIPNGIHINRFNRSRHEKGQILVVSRMFERKGIQYFLKAIKGLDLPLDVHIVGSGPYLQVLERMADSMETSAEITFHGWLDNSSPQFRQLFETASIFVFPSESENFPIVLLEAMSAGLAIITTKGTGCAEVVGDTGLLVEPRNPSELREAIVRLYENPELSIRLGHEANARVNGNFSWDAVTNQYLEIYQRVLGNFSV